MVKKARGVGQEVGWGRGVHAGPLCSITNLLLLLFLRSQLYLWDSPVLVRFLRMWLFFNPAIEVVTYRLHGCITSQCEPAPLVTFPFPSSLSPTPLASQAYCPLFFFHHHFFFFIMRSSAPPGCHRACPSLVSVLATCPASEHQVVGSAVINVLYHHWQLPLIL